MATTEPILEEDQKLELGSKVKPNRFAFVRRKVGRLRIKKPKLSKMADNAHSAYRLSLYGGVFLLLIPVIILFRKEIVSDSFTIEPILVTDERQALNESYGHILSHKLFDAIDRVKREATTKNQTGDFSHANMQTNVELDVAGMGISINNIIQYIKNLLGYQTRHVGGDLVVLNGEVIFSLRVSGEPNHEFRFMYEKETFNRSLDSVLREAAKAAIMKTSPFVLAQYHERYYEYEKAIAVLAHCLRTEPETDDVWSYQLWGKILLDQGDKIGAEMKLRKALREGKQKEVTYTLLGDLKLAMGDTAAAIGAYQSALNVAPHYVEAHASIGNLHYSKKDTSTAESFYQKALEDGDEDYLVYDEWGIFLHEHGRYKQAKDHFEKVLELKPDYAIGYSNLGASYLELGNLEEAEYYLDQATKIDSNLVQSYLNLSVLYLQQGNNEESKRLVEKAVRKKKNFYKSNNLAASIMMNLNLYEKAQYYFEQCLEIDSSKKENHDWLSYIYYRNGHYEKSISNFNQARKHNVTYQGDSYIAAAAAYAGLGKIDSALVYLDSSLIKGLTSYAYLNEKDLVPMYKKPPFKSILDKHNVPEEYR